MGGTLLNMVTVLIGSLIGLGVGHRLSLNMRESVLTGLGLITFIVGLDNAGLTGNIIIPLLATVIGVIIGELLRIDHLLERFAGWLQSRAGVTTTDDPEQVAGTLTGRERFITGFVTASLVFCIGPLTFIGSIQDGMGLASGFQFLAIKSALDFFAAMAFAASFGIGVTFTLITILIVQGGLALFGSQLIVWMGSASVAQELTNSPIINEMTAVGGVLLIGLSLTLLDIKKPRVANFLPALLIAPLMVVIAQALGISIYPL